MSKFNYFCANRNDLCRFITILILVLFIAALGGCASHMATRAPETKTVRKSVKDTAKTETANETPTQDKAEKPIDLKAKSGQFTMVDLTGERNTIELYYRVRLEKLDPNKKWTPTAIIGLHEEEDTKFSFKNSFQFGISTVKEQPDTIIFAYRIIENGKVVTQKFLGSGSRHIDTFLHLSFKNGTVTFQVKGRNSNTVSTNLSQVKAYAAAESGEAMFQAVSKNLWEN
jgi:hypothetical protein